MLRYDISDKILNKNKQALMITPTIIKNIKESLRYFGFSHHADIIHYLIKKDQLWHIDLFMIDVLKLTKKYDGGKEFERVEREVRTEKDELKKNYEKIKIDYKDNARIKTKFIENLGYIIAYELFLDIKGKIPGSLFYENLSNS